METLWQSIKALHLKGNQLTLIPKSKNYIITSPFYPKNDGTKGYFGGFLESKRHKTAEKKVVFTDVERQLDRTLLLDGQNLFIESYDKDHKFFLKNSIVWDVVNPPSDTRGPPTNYEINNVKRKFTKEFYRSSLIKFVGLAEIPKSWRRSKRTEYFVATRMKNYPLLIMSCEKNRPSQCQLKNFCHIEGKKLKPESMTSIAIREKTKEIWLADQDQNEIVSFRYQSCYHIARGRSLTLPSKLKKLGGIFIDKDERLWVSTLDKDDYHNASVFFWKKGSW